MSDSLLEVGEDIVSHIGQLLVLRTGQKTRNTLLLMQANSVDTGAKCGFYLASLRALCEEYLLVLPSPYHV